MSVKINVRSDEPKHKLKDVKPGECFFCQGDLYQRFNTDDGLARDYFKHSVFENSSFIKVLRIKDGYLNGHPPEMLVHKVDLEIEVVLK